MNAKELYFFLPAVDINQIVYNYVHIYTCVFQFWAILYPEIYLYRVLGLIRSLMFVGRVNAVAVSQ